MTKRVYLSQPDVGELEARYLVDALRSGWVAPVGPSIDAFENEVAKRLGLAHAVAVNSGTAALHLALLSIGVKAGDVVLIPTLTFAATANVVRYIGAEPVFIDCDRATGNVEPVLIIEMLAELGRAGRAATTMLSVDLFGSCADYPAITTACDEAGVVLLEDAAESLGSTQRGRAAGTFGRAAALSFNGNKVMTTSGGGMLVSNDGQVVSYARHLANQARLPGTCFEHTDIGYNYRLSNLLAALGLAQLSRLDEMIKRRRELRDLYAKLFAPVPGVSLLGAEDTSANCWLSTIVVDPLLAGWRADELAAHLAGCNVETRPIFKPLHLQPAFVGCRGLITGVAEHLFANGLALPSGSALSAAQVNRVIEEIMSFVEGRR